MAFLSVLISQLFHKTNHSFILLHYSFIIFIFWASFVIYLFFFPLASLAILTRLFGFRSSAPFLNAVGLCPNAHSEGWVLFLYMNQLCLCRSQLSSWPYCSPWPHTVILVSQKCQDMVSPRDCALAGPFWLEIFSPRRFNDDFSYTSGLKLKYH